MAKWDDVGFEFHCAQPEGDGYPSAEVYRDFLQRYPEHGRDLEFSMMVLVWWAWSAEHMPPEPRTPEQEARDEIEMQARIARSLRKIGLKPWVVE